jgi:copper homeostasis protein
VEGGTTPSFGVIRQVREKISIALYPIIRPRCGNYFYDDEDFAIMQKDILLCRQLGCDGISVGIQLRSGHIDTERMKKVVEWAYPMGVTCNRVFDAAPDPFDALEKIIECGCERVLTSGQKSAAPDAVDLLTKLVQQADERIIIMPGAGVRSSNIQTLMATGATEFHTSARKTIPDNVEFKNPAVLDIGNVVIADEAELRRIVTLLQQPN